MAWGLFVAACLGAPWLTRALLLGEKGLGLRLPDLRGFFADASVSLLVIGVIAALVQIGRGWSKLLAALVAAAFVLGTFAMYEFISVFDSLYALSHVEFLADPTFLGGSAMHLSHPGLLIAILLALALAAPWASLSGAAWWRGWGWALVASVLGLAVLPISHVHDEWRQRHALHAQIAALPVSSDLGSAAVGAELRQVFRADLQGTRWLGPLGDRPNVLLILVEAASGAALPSVAEANEVESTASMPKLDDRAQEHLLFTRIIAHQRQTNRGEYGILCGDYPKLLTDQSKMTEQVYGKARRCLPAVLRDRGYATSYIQAAPLGFMLKDQFMKKAGFEELIGDAWFERSYARTDWGVDDKAFFEQALERVAELHDADRPFFATLLTVGTHHPFTFPENSELRGAGSRQARAFRWADDALDEFLNELERRGVLRDTVVLISSDESAGLVKSLGATPRLLAQSWSFAVVMLPEPQTKRIDTVYGHVDTAISVTDLLGMESAAEGFLGRSWFRDYESPRRLFAGNTYARKAMMWKSGGGAVVCDESFRECTSTGPAGGHRFISKRRSRPASPRDRQILAEVSRLSRSGRADMSRFGSMSLLEAEESEVPAAEGKKLLTGGQYLRVPRDTTLRVDFDLEALGEAAELELHQDLFLDGHARFERKRVRLRGGERWRLSYEIPVREDSAGLVVQLYATTVSGDSATLRFRDARLSMRPGTSSMAKSLVIEDEILQADPR